MTTLTHPDDAVARPDVRTEAHSFRHRRPPKVRSNPAWLAFLLVTFLVCTSGLFVVFYAAGGYAAVQIA